MKGFSTSRARGSHRTFWRIEVHQSELMVASNSIHFSEFRQKRIVLRISESSLNFQDRK